MNQPASGFHPIRPSPAPAGRSPVVPGYTVMAELHRRGSHTLHRAVRQHDGLPVVLKSPVDDYPPPHVTAALRREYELLCGLDGPGVPRAYGLETHRDRVALVLEDVPGTTLKELIAREEIDPERFFHVAARLAATLGELHGRGVIHKDVSPAHVLVDLSGGRVVLTDFAVATRLSAERQRHLQHPHLLEGTLAYMSPEQTGRMNRDLDYRSDLYSFGITCYEMLTGRLPFASADPLELIHAHVAVAPVPPRERNPEVSPALSALVLKLIAKSAEDRYQSADGVLADLERCRAAWARGESADFALGADDVRDHFVIPQRLYGRASEVERLLQAFERVAGGASELVLVSGYAGIGKTSLIQEIHRSLARRRGHFVAGKFDQLARDLPYGALTQAFQGLVRHLLAGSDEEVAAWRERVLGALGQQAQVLADVIPPLARLLGPQPALTPLAPVESQNRFNRVFQRFLGVFARPEHPLVLFLDDLQWADPATLTLLPLFLTNPDLSGLLVIGAYRDNEVSATHPLAAVIAGLAEDGAVLTPITLPPLDAGHLAELLEDTLGAPAGPELARTVLEKTGGNPFFVTQFLQSLHQAGHIVFDVAARSWRVDQAAIEQLRITENVVDLMAERIGRLGEPTRRMLRLAACVGGRFDLATLAVISESAPAACLADLWPAVEQGLVLADEHSYGFIPDLSQEDSAGRPCFRFLHDRVHQAAYDLISPEDRPRVHLAVGRLLLTRGEDPARPEWHFDVAHHLNLAAGLIGEPAERLAVARLDLAAGRRAKVSAAFPSAHALFSAGAAVLPPDAWEAHHELAFALLLERAEAEYLTGRFDEAQASYGRLLERAATALERVEAYVLMMNQYEATARYREAIAAGLAGLRVLGVPVPEDREGQRAALASAIAAVREHLAGAPVSSLLELPRLQDAGIRKAIKLLITLWAPAYISGESALCHLVAARAVTLSLAHGNCEESAYGYVAFATTVGWELGDYGQALEFGQLGLALNERLADLRLRAKVLHRFSALVNAWRRPFATSIPYAQEAVRAGQESGDLMIAAYAQFQQSWWGMQIEPELERFLERYGPSVDYLERMRAMAYREVQQMILQWAEALRGRTEALDMLTGGGFDERSYLGTFGLQGLFGSWYVTLKLELLVTAGRFEEAAARAGEWEPVAEVFAGSVWPAWFAFWHALAAAGWWAAAPEAERSGALARLERQRDRLRVWAEHAPENFGHLYHLVAAEAARIRGDAPDGFRHYELALELAQRQASPRHRALVNERYGEFWLARGDPRVAAVFLREARFGYSRWGAGAKVAQLEQRHPGLLADAPAAHPRAPEAAPLDLQTVVKVAQALAAEIDLERLLARLMHVAAEHAGAERGHLVLEQDGVPVVHTEGGAPLAASRVVPQTLVNLVRRTGETVVLDDGAGDTQFAADPYFTRERPRSVICTAVVNQGTRLGALYLENNLAAGVFTAARAQLLQIIAAQAATAIENARLFAEIHRLQERLQAENVYLAEEIQTQRGFEEIVGRTPALRRALARVEQVAATDSTVLILGETGTGKELVARAIHRHSRRGERPMVSVNCGAISPGLVESELFGHERGAFTGALARKIGRFELADGGTLFLDEIGDLPLDLQVKLLRVLQEGEFQRVGGTQPIRVDVRVVCATHHDLERAVAAGRFRADLYYRLNVFPIQVPPLRERRDDIPTLVRHFVLKYAARMGKQIDHVSRKTLEALTAYDWPGNVRELANIVERSVIVSRGATLELGDWLAPEPAPARTLRESERDQIVAALEQCGWRVSGPRGAALRLGLKPTTLEARMKRLGIVRPE